jgi:solute carrier family 35, member F5
MLTLIQFNSAASLVCDYAGAYAILLTTPLVVSVGLSFAIPLSMIGQMILRQQYSSALYWVGACMVLLSFLFINHESHDADEDSSTTVDEPQGREGTI